MAEPATPQPEAGQRLAGTAVILVALFLAVIAVFWMVAWSTGSEGDVVNPATGAYAFLYVGGGICFVAAVAAIFLVPKFLRGGKLATRAIPVGLALSAVGACASFIGGVTLGAS
jgi:hypothetical protein